MPTHIGSNKSIISFESIPMAKVRVGNDLVYPSGATVTYYVDSNVAYTEDVDSGESCLSPKTFTPVKSGWEFVGWRQDTTASGDVFDELEMGDAPITLYAVFQQSITLSYNGNGNTGGTVEAETKQCYYNNDNITNPTFTIKANKFIKVSYSFVQWRLNSTSGTGYAPNATLTLSDNATLYAQWTALSAKTVYSKASKKDNPTVSNSTYVGISGSGNTDFVSYKDAYGNLANDRKTAGATLKIQIKSLGDYGSAEVKVTVNSSNPGGTAYITVSGIYTMSKTALATNKDTTFTFTVKQTGTITISMSAESNVSGSTTGATIEVVGWPTSIVLK